jgi:hypothetical protein
MARLPELVRYYVRVARIRLDTAVVEVDASDDGDAEQKAIELAQLLPGTEWQQQPFEPAAYQPHVETMVAQDELLESEEVEDALCRDETRYLLLKGDCGTGEGDVILQPWFNTEEPNLLASDLCVEWIGSLEQLGLTHLSERLDDLAGGSPPSNSDRILFSARSKQRDE